jgi:MarR family transcriptional regulator, organic hydroperoxide resistance regulator
MPQGPMRIGHALSKVCELKHRRMHELLDSLGLYRGQPSVLNALWQQDGVTHSELAERISRSPATVTKTVQRMEKAGFVERRPDPRDERLSRVYLTSAGRDIQAAVENVWNTFEEQACAGLSENELATLEHLLLRVCRNMKGSSRPQAADTG